MISKKDLETQVYYLSMNGQWAKVNYIVNSRLWTHWKQTTWSWIVITAFVWFWQKSNSHTQCNIATT